MADEGGSASKSTGLRDATAGLFAGAANVLAGHPLDTVKVLLQASNEKRGAVQAARSLVATSGLRGLYRGLPAPLVGGALETSVNYTVYGAVRRKLPAEAGEVQSALAAGAVAGVFLSAVLSPLELLKCRVQTGVDARVRDAAARVWREDGARGFARGFGATLAREIPGNALFFASYEALQRSASASGAGASSLTAPLCGGLAGVAYWALVLPVDSAKTRMQVLSSADAGAGEGLVTTLRREYAAKGVFNGWYAGARPVMVRAFVANAAQWMAWSWAVCQEGW